MSRPEITIEAFLDLQAIYAVIENDENRQIAGSVSRAICGILQVLPGHLDAGCTTPYPDVREYAVTLSGHNIVIVYRISADTVTIITLFYEDRDPQILAGNR